MLEQVHQFPDSADWAFGSGTHVPGWLYCADMQRTTILEKHSPWSPKATPSSSIHHSNQGYLTCSPCPIDFSHTSSGCPQGKDSAFFSASCLLP